MLLPLAAGLIIKMKGSDGSIAWYKAIQATAGSSVSSVDGDTQGNVYAHYQTCVPCTGDSCEAETDRYGRPTGGLAPICTKHLAKFAAADGCASARARNILLTRSATRSTSVRSGREGGATRSLMKTGTHKPADLERHVPRAQVRGVENG